MENHPSISASLCSTDPQSLSDLFGGEDLEDDDLSSKEEFMCPFCGEFCDVVALSFHIADQHPLHLNNGVCPVCAETVAKDLVGHIAKEHGEILKVQRKRGLGKGGSKITLRKEEHEETWSSLLRDLGDFSYIAPSISELDPLLLSFISTPVLADQQLSAQVQPCPLEAIEMQSSEDDFLEREPELLQPLANDQAEKAQRFEFVQRLLMSAIIDDNLSMNL
ncbi:hypothetical protein PIB30_000229 [Stylosanthes scabra]|uniref:Uncharacterized protein n=1 Tax=Stylosanthes scabra TaxID=79078 RepID=A0ABU6S288_9FABA|nr:hypothetical protein [Stylosanthes scabra]